MIFADKLIHLRKKAGWSQEELAERMDVTRQSVSKWEGAQSVPDLEKIIRLSELFHVSTDYLLKDYIEESNCQKNHEQVSLKRITIEEAQAFLSSKALTSKSIAAATFLCILSPICLLLLGAMSEDTNFHLSENAAGGIGMIILLVLIAIAVAIFIASGRKSAAYEYLEKEIFEVNPDVKEMVSERKMQYSKTYTRNTIIGTTLCIIALIPFFGGSVLNEEHTLFLTAMLALSFVLAGIGVIFLIISGIIWSSFQKLLQEGEYTKKKKQNQSKTNAIATAYWLIVTAIFLLYTLTTNHWGNSWIIWVIAGVIFPIVAMIANLTESKNK